MKEQTDLKKYKNTELETLGIDTFILPTSNSKQSFIIPPTKLIGCDFFEIKIFKLSVYGE